MENTDKFRILIIDGDQPNSLALGDILKWDYAVYIAPAAADALNMMLESKPDLIVLDAVLPDMSGFELLERLKEMEETRSIPVIFITGLSGVEDEERGLRLGAVDYITKPFVNSIVLARVGTHIQIVRHIRTIERLGMIDALLDIPNRRFFDMRFKEEWRRACRHRSSLSLMMIDVDHFKRYNDAYGHPQGDAALQYMGSILTRNLRRPSDMAARLGGEEFAVLLADTNLRGALIVAEHIRGDVEASEIPCSHTGELTAITVSIGVNALIPSTDQYCADFIQQTDKYLYAAKAGGRNRIASPGL
ncbi:MAG: diguanylate cyclase [Treponema sp.]|jgi:diguanylate cyclase (GGDEF)-like protein|nr:diguanylate cyclase [Treponema sp.]